MSNTSQRSLVVLFIVAIICVVSFGLIPTNGVNASLTCLDESGKPVDWFFIYKVPATFQFAYKDANDHTEVPLTLNAALLNRTETGSLGATLHQIYQGKKSNDLSFALWNDDHPYEPAARSTVDDNVDDMLRATPYPGGGGHTKGVLAVDKSGGFYLLHSVPKFPDLRPETFTWNASVIYAQSFLCLSLDAKNIAGLAEHLKWINPDFFDVHLPAPMAAAYPSIQELVSGKRFRGNNSVVIQTRAGKSFRGFGKSNTWGGDLYEQLVEPQLNNGFTWQTWRRGSEMPSMCAPPSAYASANILTTGVGNVEFSYTRDHSKWGVSVNKASGLVCVGDINRMFSQRKRGGGTMCFQSAALWYGLNGTIKKVEPC